MMRLMIGLQQRDGHAINGGIGELLDNDGTPPLVV
jgi:hypothetical protein